jgi:hypothetical protein
VISRLKTGKVYAAVIRFNKPFGQSKQVQYKAYAKTTMSALADLIKQLNDTTSTVKQPIATPTVITKQAAKSKRGSK